MYFWRVFAVNNNGFSNQKTGIWSFHRNVPQNNIPGNFNLLIPTNNTLNINIPIDFSWTNASGAEYYQVEIAEDSAFAKTRYKSQHLFSERYTQYNFPENMKSYWRVIAYNSNGIKVSQTYAAFTTQILLKTPPNPALPNPSSGATDVGIPVVLKWGKATTAESYTIQLARDKYFKSILREYSGVRDTFQIVDSLDQYVTYYWRVKALNARGNSGYNITFNFRTRITLGSGGPCPGVEQFEYGGKIYHTVQIADQCWMKENLNIGIMIDSSRWPNKPNQIEKYCYHYDTLNCEKYGGIYEIDESLTLINGSTSGICPIGWHIPSWAELTKLVDMVKNGNNLKAIGQGSGAGAGTDSSGFSLLLAGGLSGSTSSGLGTSAIIVSSSSFYEWGFRFYYTMQTVADNSSIRIASTPEHATSSVRCMKD